MRTSFLILPDLYGGSRDLSDLPDLGASLADEWAALGGRHDEPEGDGGPGHCAWGQKVVEVLEDKERTCELDIYTVHPCISTRTSRSKIRLKKGIQSLSTISAEVNFIMTSEWSVLEICHTLSSTPFHTKKKFQYFRKYRASNSWISFGVYYTFPSRYFED